MKPILNLFVLLALSLLAWPVLGGEPCASLSSEEREAYLSFGEEVVKAYEDEDFPRAVQATLNAMEICDEDPRTKYNLARVYQAAGNCNMALFWYEQVLELDPEGPYVKAIKEQRAKAGRYKTELQVECSNSAKISVECSNPGVLITLGEFSTLKCPYRGRIDAGTYKLTASLEGFQDYSVQVQLVAGENNRLLVPELLPEIDSSLGTLRVSCPESVKEVVLTGPGYNDVDVPCPLKIDLDAGYYTVRMEDELPETFEIVPGQVYALQLSRSVELDSDQVGLFIGLRFAPGLALVSGDLYEEDNETPYGEELVGMQPSLLTLAVENEIGYRINERWAVGAQGRFEVANFALLGLAFVRWTPLIVDWWRGSLSAGLGGGRIYPTVETSNGDRPLAHMGPFFASFGLHSNFDLSSLFSLMLALQPRIGMPDVGVNFDLSAGIEINF